MVAATGRLKHHGFGRDHTDANDLNNSRKLARFAAKKRRRHHRFSLERANNPI